MLSFQYYAKINTGMSLLIFVSPSKHLSGSLRIKDVRLNKEVKSGTHKKAWEVALAAVTTRTGDCGEGEGKGLGDNFHYDDRGPSLGASG